MTTFLVHGMFHGPRCRDHLSAEPEAQGHVAVARDLTGCGSDATPHDQVPSGGWARSIEATICGAGDGHVVLVDHSRAGFVASQALGLTALMLPDGACTADVADLVSEAGMGEGKTAMATILSDDRLSMLPPADASDLFLGDCAPDTREWGERLIGNKPFAPLVRKLALLPERYGRSSTAYIRTTRDRTIPIAAQDAMIEPMIHDRVYSMDMDHSPMLSDAKAFAAILVDIARTYAGPAE